MADFLKVKVLKQKKGVFFKVRADRPGKRTFYTQVGIKFISNGKKGVILLERDQKKFSAEEQKIIVEKILDFVPDIKEQIKQANKKINLTY